MANFKLYVIFIFLIPCITKFAQKNFDERLHYCIQSEKFNSYFKLCESNKDTFLVYDNTKKVKIDKFHNLSCGKKINLVAKSFVIDVNSSSLSRTDAIILLDYKEEKGKYSFHFINLFDNSSLRLSFNNKGGLIDYMTGVH